jgi:iron-sulfur cluster assembly protein
MEVTQQIPVSFTAGALNEVRRLMAEAGFDTSKKLRVGVKGGGCSGLSYVLGFDEKEAGDEEYSVEGIPVILNPSHQIYLYGMQVDWQDGLNSRGFTFNNPNASTTCGCGSSFAV